MACFGLVVLVRCCWPLEYLRSRFGRRRTKARRGRFPGKRAIRLTAGLGSWYSWITRTPVLSVAFSLDGRRVLTGSSIPLAAHQDLLGPKGAVTGRLCFACDGGARRKKGRTC
jgi:hypothetical protein